jgi:hypothetical protein
MSNITPSSCSTTVQIWVDTNAATAGSTKGVYLVDNMTNNGSSNEGTATLTTTVTQGTNICWQIYNIDPKSTSQLTIQSIGNASVWGASGQPGVVAGVPASTFTGQAQASGSTSYQIKINVVSPGNSGKTLTLNPSINVK